MRPEGKATKFLDDTAPREISVTCPICQESMPERSFPRPSSGAFAAVPFHKHTLRAVPVSCAGSGMEVAR